MIIFVYRTAVIITIKYALDINNKNTWVNKNLHKMKKKKSNTNKT